jgi:hypothetical protein
VTHIAGGRALTVMTAATPVVGSGVMGYDASVSLVQDGAMLMARPLLTEDGRAAIDLESVVSQWNDLKPAKLAKFASTQPVNTRVPGLPDRMDMLIQQMTASITVPLGKAVVVGGMTAAGPVAKDAEPRKLYLIIEVTSPAVP